MALTQKHRMAAIGTPLGEDVLCLASFSGREELGRLFQYEVELLSENHNISFKEIVGHNVTVRLNTTRSNEPRFFNGFVSRFTQHPSTDRYASYRATIVPWFWFLTRTSDCRIWSGADKTRTAPEIIKEVFNSRGFKDFEDKLSGNYTPWDFCVQYRETDFNFISRLMEQEGIYYYFKHEDGKHTLVLADSTDDHQPFPKYEEIKFRPPSGGTSDLEYIRDWMRSKELFTGKYVHTDFDFENPSKNLCTEPKIIPRGHAQADFEIFDYPGEFTKPDDGKNWAKIRIEELQARHELLHGSADARGMAAGFTFELKDLSREDQNRKYLIVSVAHSMHVDGYDSGGSSSGGGDSYNCSFTVLPATEAFRPSRITPKPLIQGPQTAIVVGPKGEEIHTDNYGRVKLKFHWDRYSKADEKSSCWVRVSQAWAGKKWGAIYLPRIGQEVVVEFLEGDPDLPLITGRVYNGEAMPPYDLPAEKTKSTLKSNSTKGGDGFNEIRFEDKKDGEQIFIHAQKNLDVRVRNNVRETNYGNRDMRVGWEKDGKKGGNLNTLVRQDVNTHIKGAQFELVEKQLNQTVKEDVVEDHQKNHTTMVGEKFMLNAQEIIIEGAQVISEKAGKITLEGAQGVHVKGAMVCVEGSSGVSLKVGGNYVVVSAAGVAINGTMVMINSGGAPLPVEAAKAVTETPIEDPLEARLADDGKTGQKTGVAATPIQRTKRTLKPQKAPPYVPPQAPELLPPPICPAPQPKSEKPCGIKNLEVKCKHGRVPGPAHILQVVAETTKKETSLFDGPIKIQGEKGFGGEDQVTGKVVSVDGGSGGKKALCWNTSAGDPGESEWKAKESDKFQVKAPDSTERFPINARPECFYVHGKGCDDFTQMVTVESYPSQNYSVSVGLEFFKNWSDKINKAWEDWGKTVLALSPVAIKPKIDPPKGSFKANWGWKEEKDWRAYFELTVQAGLDPIIGIGIEIEVSALKLMGAAFGIPPVLTELGSEHLADILLTGGAGANASLTGGPTAKFYGTGEEKLQGNAVLAGTGFAEVKLTARVGSKYIVQASWIGYGKIEFKPEGRLTLQREGLFISSKGELDPLILGYKIETRMFYFFSKTKEDSWKVWDTITVWETGPTKILPDES